MTRVNDLVDKVYVISLKTRPDRQSLFDIANGNHVEYEYWLRDPDPQGGKKGCFFSHQELAQHVLTHEPQVQRVLIFEDDAVPYIHYRWFVGQVKSYLDHADPEIFFLNYGTYPDHALQKVSPEWPNVRHGKFWSLAAYMLNRRGMEKMAALEWVDRHVDEQITDVFSQMDCVYPMWFNQSTGTSDINKVTGDVNETVLPLTAWCSENMALFWSLVALLSLLVLVLIIWFLVWLRNLKK